MLPPVGPIHAAVGPWMALMLLSILGAVIGFFVGPLFSGLFEPGGALRMKRSGSPYDPVSGKAIYPARRSTGSRKQAFSPAVPDHRVS